MAVSKKISATRLKKGTASVAFSVFRYALLISIGYLVVFPIISAFTTSIKAERAFFDLSIYWLPKYISFDSYKYAFQVMDYPTSFLRTLSLNIVSAGIEIIMCAIVAYGFARFQFKFKNVFEFLLMMTIVIPTQIYIVSMVLNFKYVDVLGILGLFNKITGIDLRINILNTNLTFYLPSLFAMGLRSGLLIYIYIQFFSELPKELEEAAKVDGANVARTFVSIMLPNVVPTVLVCFILTFVWQWNDTFYTTYFNATLGTLSMKIKSMSNIVSEYLGGWGLRGTANAQLLISVGVFLCVIPLILLFIFCQRFFVQGVERSGLVG